MYKYIRERKIPEWLKVLLNILITITIVYWLGYFIYKILDLIRLFFHTMTEKKVYWIALVIILICVTICLFFLEFNTNVKPFTIAWEWLKITFNDSRDFIADFIHT